MKVKKYTAPTMPEAMKIVRSELGRSAVILNSREQKTKGFLGLFKKKYIEVFAAVDPQPRRERNEFSHKQEANLKVKKTPNLSNNQVLSELESLKQQLTHTNYQPNVLPEPIQSIINELEEQDINKGVLNQIIPYLLEKYYGDKLTDAQLLKDEVKQFLIDQLQGINQQGSLFKSKYIYLFGPTGVGKTTTIAKLAATQSVTKGKKVAFITLDTYRIAAIDQLKTYAKILNVPIEVAYSKEDLIRAKEKFKHYDVVFIDSAGRNYRKDEYIEQIKEYVNCEEEDEVYCVLSLTSKQKDLEDIYTRFSQLDIKKVIFTKVDETTQFGPIFNLWNKHKFQISYLTHGQSVPDDIQDVSPELIVNMLVGEKRW